MSDFKIFHITCDLSVRLIVQMLYSHQCEHTCICTVVIFLQSLLIYYVDFIISVCYIWFVVHAFIFRWNAIVVCVPRPLYCSCNVLVVIAVIFCHYQFYVYDYQIKLITATVYRQFSFSTFYVHFSRCKASVRLSPPTPEICNELF